MASSRLQAQSMMAVGGIDGGASQATPILLGAKTVPGNLRVNAGLLRGPAK